MKCLAIFLMLVFAESILGLTNHFIGSFRSTPSATPNNYPYPVGQCCTTGYGSSFVKYECSQDKSMMIETFYGSSDSMCSGNIVSNATYSNMTNTGDGKLGSWECNGNNYYVAITAYVLDTVCAGNAITLTTYYGVDVCYQVTANGNYSSATCSMASNTASINTYDDSDNTCQQSTLGAPVTASGNCGFLYKTTIGEVYGKIIGCDSDPLNQPTTTTTATTTAKPNYANIHIIDNMLFVAIMIVSFVIIM
jgi:hypothetical protein